jgi:CO/xanthine dehydrogenase Mo-binding subunit
LTSELQYVGQTYPVHDAAQKVTGELVYGSDIELHGMLYAKLLLSPIPHGMVTKIDSSAAEALPGVVKVFSHLNSPTDVYCRARLTPEQELCPRDETLFSEHVRFVGDRVAAVVATSQAIAEAAVALIDVEYLELPAIFTTEEAQRRDDLPIHPGGNVFFEYEEECGRSRPPRPAPRGSTMPRSSRMSAWRSPTAGVV